jgi:hypothetical protein
MTRINLQDLTATELKKLKSAQLNAAWKEKYPDGMYFIVSYKEFGVVKWRCGKVTRRPTSGSCWRTRTSDSYLSASFADYHKVFKHKEDFLRVAKEKGLHKHPFVTALNPDALRESRALVAPDEEV